MAEHAPPARKPAEPAASAKAPAAAAPGSYGELLNRRSEAALAGYAQLLAHRAAANPLTAPLRPPGPQPVQLRPNGTGLPDRLKTEVEGQSGLAMDDVRVHRNSSQPAKLGALAYAQGSDIHLGPGQERHLPHEAWHVVQQKQGRVGATGTTQTGARLNDDPALEAEADTMASRPDRNRRVASDAIAPALRVVQRVIAGFEHYQAIGEIPDPWVDAFVADTADPGTHLYQDDMVAYLETVGPRAAWQLEHEGNHWNVQFGEKRIATAADGDCGVHAIDAIEKGPANVHNGHRASADKIASVRAAISQAIAAYSKDEIRMRILEEIRGCDSVAETGFGRRLTQMLEPIQQTAAERQEAADTSGSTGSSTGRNPSSADKSGAADEFKQALSEGGAETLRRITKTEGATRIGFEIEVGESYVMDRFEGASAFVNETLLEFHEGGVGLEMLLDDPQPAGAGKLRFQVEFRTTPLAPADMNKATGKIIRAAISAFRAQGAFESNGDPGRGWKRTPLALDLIRNAKGLSSQNFRFKAKPMLAQHVTTSINLGSYPLLDSNEQAALYPAGKGSEDKPALYANIVKSLGSGEIDASTTGRNNAKATVKTPVEAMLASEIAHGKMTREQMTEFLNARVLPRSVALGTSGTRNISDPVAMTNTILASGAYPKNQTEPPDREAHLARAEKLQPPLFDPVNKELRVLVEHRTDEIVTGANAVLNGGSSPVWDRFLAAIKKMDRKRR